MERVDRRRNIKFVSEFESEDRRRGTAIKYFSSPFLKSITTIDQDILAIEIKKTKVNYDKLILCGLQVLDYSKIFMTQKIYDVMSHIYGNSFKFLSTDTGKLN